MKQNKIVAIFLAFIMIMGCLPQGVLANGQNPIRSIEKVTITHQNTNIIANESSITPSIQIDWKGPEDNDMPTTPGVNDQLQATHYDVVINDLSPSGGNKEVTNILASDFTLNAGLYSLKLEDYFSNYLKNGTLYSTQLKAKHRHTQEVNGVVTKVDSPSTGDPIPTAYFITDFDIKASGDSGLTFSWEYIPGVSYRLFYDKGRMNNISEIKGTVVDISAQQAKAHLNEDGTRVEWEIEEAVAGQIYSAYVLPVNIESAAVGFEDIQYNKTTPKIIHVTPNIKLEIEKLGESKLRLTWDINDSAWVLVGNSLYQTIIYQITDKGEEELGRIHNDNNGNIDVGYFECAMPTEEVTYRVDFILKNANTNTNEKAFSAGPKRYVPDELKEVPYQPNIPQIFPYKSGDIVSNEDLALQDKYKVKFDGSYDDLVLTNNNIDDFRAHTFHYNVLGNEASIQLVWDAPQIGTTGEVDYDLYYDIWVSESATTFTPNEKVVSNLQIKKGDPNSVIYKHDGLSVVGMKTVLEGLKTNKTYYIKMVSKRKFKDDDEAISLPTIKEVNIPKTGDVYEPPVIGKPPLQVDSVEEHAVKVKWAEKWYEIMAKEAQANLYTDPVEKLLATWGHSRVFLTGDSTLPIRFRDEAGTYGEPTDLYGATVEQKLRPYNTIIQQGNYVLRSVDMGSDTHYRVKVIKQTEVNAEKGNKTLEEWVMATDIQDVKNNWLDITDVLTDTTVEGVSGKLLNITHDYRSQELEANTAYVVLISAARKIDGDWKYSTVPSYILATTKTDHKSELETPKTPRLYNYTKQDVKDTEVTVRWIYNKNFDYELVYSRLDDPENAEKWEFTEEDKKTFVDGGEAYVTISGLLPETTYNFWIRATQKAELVTEGAPKVSDWSTPVTSTTLTISNPLPPSGLGLADYKSIQEAGKDFKPSGEEYLTVEWMRNASDLNNKDEKMTYEYVVEFADNPEFLDATVVTVSDSAAKMAEKTDKHDTVTVEFLSKNMVRFNGLRANMPYYIKVKTVLTYKNEDKEIVKESEYTSYVRLITNKSSGEYDGGDNENVVTYDKPIKETYTNGVWTYELQDVATITSSIINKSEYFYTITMKHYKNKNDAQVRRIKMPKMIMDTLINRGMALKVETNIGIYEIPATALKNYVKSYEAKDTLQIDFTRTSQADIASYGRSYPEVYTSGEKIEVTLLGKKKKTTVNKLDDYMRIKLKLDIVGSYNYSNFYTYQYNYSAGSWVKYNNIIETQDSSYLSFATVNTGLNAIYEKKTTTTSMASSYNMNTLASAYNIQGLGTTYVKNAYVGGSQYVQLLLGIQLKRAETNLSVSATSVDYQKARAAGIYRGNGGYVTKEQAIAGIIKIYEVKNGKLKPSNKQISGTSAAYSEAVRKAYAIGLIDEINPQQYVTYEELCDWLVQVL